MIIKIIKMSKQKINLHEIFIYGLKENGLKEIKYIGKTNNTKRRLREHIIESKKINKSYKHKWINSVIKKGGYIEIEIVENVHSNNWEEREIYWINELGISNLTNYIIGGGGGRPSINYLSYENARIWILENKKGIDRKYKWDLFCKKDTFPSFLPKCPEKVYKKEWMGYGDWLGTGRKSNKTISNNFLDFESSKKIVSKININTRKEWDKICLSKNKPLNIPSNPQKFYKKEWNGWKDWLSSKRFSENNRLTYENAKKIVNSLKLNTHKEWVEYCKKNNLEKIPFNPQRTYKEEWEGWNVWLGPKNKYLDFFKAKKIASKLKLKNRKEWFEYFDNNSLQKIPKHPQSVYSDKWISWKNWLGK